MGNDLLNWGLRLVVLYFEGMKGGVEEVGTGLKILGLVFLLLVP